MTAPVKDLPVNGKLVANIVYFVRTLRRAGVPVGTAQTLQAIRAVQAAGFTQRRDFFFTLRATLITRAEHLDVFERIFSMFWRDPEFLEVMVQTMLPMIQTQAGDKDKKTAEQRAAEAMMDGAPPPPQPDVEDAREEIEVDAEFSFSADEKLGSMDFEQMSNAELAMAKAAIASMTLPIKPIQSRRLAPALTGNRIDARATLRAAMRTGGEVIDLPKRNPKQRNPDLVALCDISGSMSTYSRLFMHFLHSVSVTKGQGWAKVHAFTFGTRLTNITRSLSERDPDAALKAVGQQSQDWDGGTRIGASLEQFNKHWSRRVLSRGAVVLLVTDGLERQNPEDLEREARRLRLSARQVIWLNPLMRWDGFTPQAAGIRALLPHVDSFHSCHSLNSFRDLTDALSTGGSGEKQRLMSLL
ncbi:VWA domain-containing protein [Amylibacter sp. IMCC11727]|uniref:vWA domain-containing protein n=1 Tax=Amylibacter sp. IMCC11727 TaxID=3039851 RepID=UPI00244E2530|nr:VWA domain-containing protein [Amylibacter sp. IMCC11727]WGI20354.1 VWA domain-containing protein [Amylibacter sp. IMCC11727]